MMENNATAKHQSFFNSWEHHGQQAAFVKRRSPVGCGGRNESSSASIPYRNPPKKAKKRRKCFVPVGPAGVWFQAQEHPGKKVDADIHDGDHEFSEHAMASSQQEPSQSSSSVSICSPAWTAAQCALGLSTPSLPPYWSQEKKYSVMKSHVPSDYLLLNDVLNGQTDWVAQQRMLVQVSSIQSVTANDHLWTAILEDEAGTTLTAWIQPELVRKEQQNNKWVRVGNVWLLVGCTIYLIPQKEGWDRILLVDESNLSEMWSPASADSIPTNEYIAWMEARNSLSSSLVDSWPDDLQKMQLGDAERAEGSELEERSDQDEDEDDGEEESAVDCFAPTPTVVEKAPVSAPQTTKVRYPMSPQFCRRDHTPSTVFTAVPSLAGQTQRGDDSYSHSTFVSQQPAQSFEKNGTVSGRETAVVTPLMAHVTRVSAHCNNAPSPESEPPTQREILDNSTMQETTGKATGSPVRCSGNQQIIADSSTKICIRRMKRKRKTPLLWTEEAAKYLSNECSDEEESFKQKNGGADKAIDDDWLVGLTCSGPSVLFCAAAFEGLDVDLDG